MTSRDGRAGRTQRGLRAEGAARTVRRVHELVRRATDVSLPVRLWDGTVLGPPEAGYRLVLETPWSLRALFPPTDLRAGEAYMTGAVDVEGDIVEAMKLGELFDRPLPPALLARVTREILRLPRPPAHHPTRRARLRGRKHSRSRDRQAVQFHYDLGNEFFRQFLDPHLVYSCAYFGGPEDDLATAQARKLDLVCRKLRLEPGKRLLDVGCGWGSLVVHAARQYGVQAVGVTLSEQQADLARQWVSDAGLSDQVEIRLQDYREVRGQFEAVASVGMFEHVGPRKLGEYFRAVRRLVAPGGLFLNHGITTGQRGTITDLGRGNRTFVAQYVFPDGGLVPAWRAVREMEDCGLEVVDLEQLRPHYARTLRAWVANLEANRARALAVASERDYRVWRAYMAGSAVGFESGDLGVVQVLGSAGARLPDGRAWMLPRRVEAPRSERAAETVDVSPRPTRT